MHKGEVAAYLKQKSGVTETPSDQKCTLHEFLESINLSCYLQLLTDQAIDLAMLQSGMITDADLKEIGICKLGHRKKLLAEVCKR